VSDLQPLAAADFTAFFKVIYTFDPFPWQQMLLDRVAAEGWPDVVDLPTASGKTAAIDVAVFALALQADRPQTARTAGRRVWFVVDRRIVVDEAYERAANLAEQLLDAQDGVVKNVAERLCRVSGTGLPLAVARLRGGVPRSVAWAYHPAQPAVITSTVDQYGSRLLFRGYGVGKGSRPIHAALAGTDGLVLLDESHLARPLVQTVGLCRRLEAACPTSPLGLPFQLTRLSATVSVDAGETVFPVSAEQRRAALDHPLLDRRFGATKVATLVRVDKRTAVADPLVGRCAQLAEAHVSAGRRRIAVMVNRVSTATAIHAAVLALAGDRVDVVLLTGRMRPVDRDQRVDQWTDTLKAGSAVEPERPVVLVTTQCLEVGADFSFDALVAECASLDAIRQRFGRLDRLGTVGNAGAEIVCRADDCPPVEKLDDADPLDPVYGNAAARTWAWLNEHATSAASAEVKPKGRVTGRARVIDLGVNATTAHLEATPAEVFAGLLAPVVDAPILLPAYLDLLAQTGPAPAVEPDVSPFLHGPDRGQPEASVVWRADLDDNDSSAWIETMRLMPPLTGEKLSVPLTRLRKWLSDPAHFAEPDDGGDVETEPPPDAADRRTTTTRPATARPFIRFAGRSEVDPLDDPTAIGPGDVIVVPAARGFPPQLGTRLDDVDVYEQAYKAAHGRDVVRLSSALPVPVGFEAAWAAATVPVDDLDDDAVSATLDAVFPHTRPDRLVYPAGGTMRGLVVFGKGKPSRDELNPFEFDAGDLQFGPPDRPVDLAGHTRAVGELAAALAAGVTGEPMAAVVKRAADLHDLGKADERFQRLLRGGRRAGVGPLLAKSRGQFRPVVPSPLPDQFRHEMLSVQLAGPVLAANGDRDLILHLIAAHHGHARPFAPVVVDFNAPPVSLALGGRTFAMSADERQACPPHHLGSGVPERFWLLTRRYGWWGLALLEALLRLADQQASRAAHEQEGR
jgi:CRISPR-associated endonuclease/helicase Cas3